MVCLVFFLVRQEDLKHRCLTLGLGDFLPAGNTSTEAEIFFF